MDLAESNDTQVLQISSDDNSKGNPDLSSALLVERKNLAKQSYPVLPLGCPSPNPCRHHACRHLFGP